MPSENRRIMLTVCDEWPFRVLGLDPATAGAREVSWALFQLASLVDEAAADLDKILTRGDWNALADTLNGCLNLWADPGDRFPPMVLIIAELEDGDRLNGLGEKWDVHVPKLVANLKLLSPAHAASLLAAVRYFWENHEAIDHQVDEWWKVSFRTKRDRVELQP